eukprot:784228-Amorphochlora_amoeboformis.AAC.1
MRGYVHSGARGEFVILGQTRQARGMDGVLIRRLTCDFLLFLPQVSFGVTGDFNLAVNHETGLKQLRQQARKYALDFNTKF